MAEQLELFVQMIAAPPVKKNTVSSEAFTTVDCATDISLADLAEWEAMEDELSKEDDAVIDAKFQHYNVMWDEEKQLDEELDTLRAQLKQEKAYNHRENQAHQQKVKKLQQMLQKVKKEDASRKKASELKVGKIKQEEKDDLTQKLEQARDLNKRLKQKLDAPALVESKDTTKRLKAELHTLGLALSDEANKARLLGQEFEGNSAIQRVRNIEVEQANQQLETLQKKLDTLKAAAGERSQKIRDMSRQRDEMLEAKDDAKEFVRALRCKYKVAKTKYEDMQGVPRTTTTLSKSKRTSRAASSKSEEHPL